MEFATTVRHVRTDDSYHFGQENSIVNDFLVISAGAILGANARWIISRYAARILGPVFPYGTLFINVSGSFVVGFFQLCFRNHGLLRARPVVDDAREFLREQSALPGRSTGWHGGGQGGVECQSQWLFKSRSI